MEYKWLLIHQDYVPAQVGQPEGPQIFSVEADYARIGIEQAEQQIGDGRFAAAAGAYYGQGLACADGEADTIEDRHGGQVVNLRAIGNRPVPRSFIVHPPRDNRPQVAQWPTYRCSVCPRIC